MSKKKFNAPSKNFVQVSREMWTSLEFLQLPQDPAIHVVFNAAMMGPHTGIVPGLIKATRGEFLGALNLPLEITEPALKWLEDHKMVIPGWDYGCAYATYARHFVPQNPSPKWQVAARSWLASVRHPAIKKRCLRYVASLSPSAPVSATRQKDTLSQKSAAIPKTKDLRSREEANPEQESCQNLGITLGDVSVGPTSTAPAGGARLAGSFDLEESRKPKSTPLVLTGNAPHAEHLWTLAQLEAFCSRYIPWVMSPRTRAAAERLLDIPLACEDVTEVLRSMAQEGKPLKMALLMSWLGHRREGGTTISSDKYLDRDTTGRCRIDDLMAQAEQEHRQRNAG